MYKNNKSTFKVMLIKKKQDM